MIDQVIGNFRVLSLLGSGGMGDVYLAEHQGIQTRVAIKMLHAPISRDAAHVQRFFNEARIVGKIKHSGIAKIFDVGFHQDRAYLVMELLEGESLAARIQRGRVPLTEALDIAYQISSVLAATHNAGIVHRDLKPDNIYLVPDDELGRPRVKVLDFGIAKLGGTLSGGPKTIGTMGTPAYMAPEQWGDAGSVDWRADLYSLGCVAFEMVTGRPPFPASTITEAFRNHTQAPPPSARTIVADVPAAFDELVVRLLAKQAPDRADSTVAVTQALDMVRVSIDPDAQWTSVTPPYGARVAPPTPTSPGRAATTLGASAAQVGFVPIRKRRGALIGGGVLLVLAAATTIAVRGSGGDAPVAASQPPPPPPPAPAAKREPPPAPPASVADQGPEPPKTVEPVSKPVEVKKSPAPKPRVPAKAPPAKAAPTPDHTKPTPQPAPKSELEDRT